MNITNTYRVECVHGGIVLQATDSHQAERKALEFCHRRHSEDGRLLSGAVPANPTRELTRRNAIVSLISAEYAERASVEDVADLLTGAFADDSNAVDDGFLAAVAERLLLRHNRVAWSVLQAGRAEAQHLGLTDVDRDAVAYMEALNDGDISEQLAIVGKYEGDQKDKLLFAVGVLARDGRPVSARPAGCVQGDPWGEPPF